MTLLVRSVFQFMNRYSAGIAVWFVSLLACALVVSCSSFEKVYFSERADMTNLSRSSQTAKVYFDYKNPRHVAFMGGSSSTAQINDRAAHLILEGKFPQAEALLQSVTTDDPQCAQAYNNLGIVYESAGNQSRAFDFYSHAVILNPYEEYYQTNIRGVGHGK